MAVGDGRVDGGCREDGDSSVSSLRRGEINECGVAVDLGESDGLGETVTLGAAEALGLGDADGRGATDGLGDADVFLRKFHLKVELLASAVSMLVAVNTSPPLKVPSVLFAGKVAVGGWPTGIGSYVSSTTGFICLPPNCDFKFAIVTGAPLVAFVSATHFVFAESISTKFSLI